MFLIRKPIISSVFYSFWMWDFYFNMIHKNLSPSLFKIYFMLRKNGHSYVTYRASLSQHSFFSKGHNYFIINSCKNISILLIIFSHILNFKCGNGTVAENCETTVWLTILLLLCPNKVSLFLYFSSCSWGKNEELFWSDWHPTPENQLHPHLTKSCLGELREERMTVKRRLE